MSVDIFSTKRRPVLALFLAVVGGSLGALLILLALDLSFSTVTTAGLLSAIHERGLREAMGSLAEVLTAVLGLSLTVVAIVVQLASQRYSPKIVDLFMKDPINIFAFAFMVASCIYVLLLPSVAIAEMDLTLIAGLVLAIINFGLLLPYIGYVFSFLQPDSIITKIETNAEKSLQQAMKHSDNIAPAQEQIVTAIERIADNCLAALGQSDRRLALHSINTLEVIICNYLSCKKDLPSEWFVVPSEFFLTLSEEFFQEIVEQKAWVEAKSLMEFEHMFRRALGEMNELISQFASSTRMIGEAAMKAGDEEALSLVLRFFNTYIRHSLNARNVRAVYNILYQYRRLSTAVMEYYPLVCGKVVEHLVYYGRISNAMGLPFATVTAAHDVRVLCELAFSSDKMDVQPILELFLSLDQDPAGKTEELALMGVRKAQSILGAFFLTRGAEELVNRIRHDMKDDPYDRLLLARDGILNVREKRFWEITDRGFNFDYVEDEMRPYISEFFAPLLEAVKKRAPPKDCSSPQTASEAPAQPSSQPKKGVSKNDDSRGDVPESMTPQADEKESF